MCTVRSSRLITAIFAALAMIIFVNARAAFSQDAPESGTSVDADWEKVDTGPPIDEDAASADKVLEIPQAKCSNDDESCDANASNDANTDDDGAINAPSPGAPPQTFDQDTASNAQDSDWGTVDEYQNQQAYNVPYPIYSYYQTTAIGALRRPSQLPQSTFAPMSSPLSQATRPPLSQGPWMTPPAMSAFSRPAGSPMMMSAPLAGFHR